MLKLIRSFYVEAVIILLFTFLFFMKVKFPALADEVDFLKPIETWIHGRPVREGLWHTPLYPWLLSGLGKLIGHADVSYFRSVGLFCVLGAACVIYSLLGQASRQQRHVVFSLTLLTPTAIGSALVVDYDTTLLVFSTSLFFGHLIWTEKEQIGARFLIWQALLLAFCLMSKETTPLAYPLATLIVTWFKLRGNRWKALPALAITSLITAAGTVFFLVLTWAWCRHFGISLRAPFEMMFLGLSRETVREPMALTRVLWINAEPIFWLGIPTATLFLYFGSKRLWKRGLSSAVLAILLTVLVVLLTYTFALKQTTYHFTKIHGTGIDMAPLAPISIGTGAIRASFLTK